MELELEAVWNEASDTGTWRNEDNKAED